MTDKQQLAVIKGDRATLELEALRNIAMDFEKFLAISRTLAPAANGQLKLVDAQENSENKSEPQ